MHTYKHMYVNTHLSSYINTYKHANIPTNIYTCARICPCIQLGRRTHMHIHIRTHTYTCSQIHSLERTFIHTYVHTYIHPSITLSRRHKYDVISSGAPYLHHRSSSPSLHPTERIPTHSISPIEKTTVLSSPKSPSLEMMDCVVPSQRTICSP